MPLVSVLMVLLLIALFFHTALGLQVVIEDYVHSGAKFGALITVRLGCVALAVAGILATMRIAFSGRGDLQERLKNLDDGRVGFLVAQAGAWGGK